MKPNFDISLPSIPGKTIKFKIQDIKQTSFGSQKSRFIQNKKGLTKKFIESFNNFHQKQIKLQSQTQASQSSFSRISGISDVQKRPLKFRNIIAQDKKHMISLYDKYKSHQAQIPLQTKFNKGYTFDKSIKQVNSSKVEQNQQQIQPTNKFVTDNYYFTSNIITPKLQLSDNKQQGQKKREKLTAVFKNQIREKVMDRAHQSDVPGPGFYHVKDVKEHNNKNKKYASSRQTDDSLDYKKLKNIITSIVGQQKAQYQNEQEEKQQKQQKMQYMFQKDDRNRFGQQKYPISSKVNVPGPGAYEIMKGIQEQSKKVTLVQEQRKLLKQWFNN